MRKKGSNGRRLDTVEDEMRQAKRALEAEKEKFENHIRFHVMEDLKERRYGDKPMFSYEDIANRHGISTSAVQRIAMQEGLTRRKKA